ncbi:FSH1 domain-containing protein [Mycena kentingensis (nom. inval.)]|nr:FSH1 domain-containing protein [Mycena kentingensis (nom. inval.)]
MSAKTTVLALHGFSQNAAVFSKRLGALRKQCGKTVEFVFLDAPMVLQPVDLVGSASASLDAGDAVESRAWFRWNEDKSEAVGLPQSIRVLRDVLKERRFDGVLGFSQGAGMAAFLSALLERPNAYPDFLIDGQPPHPPFKFCVAVSGFRLRGSIGESIFSENYRTPTLHVIGKTDIIVVEERSRALVAVSDNARVEEHDGGHFVPSKGNWRKFLAAYLADPAGDVPSPSASAESSGTSTPGEGLTPRL